MARNRRRPLIAALLVLGVLATAGFASAAQLTLTPTSLDDFAAGHPCPGAVQATTPTSVSPVQTVTITAPPACAGRTLQVTVDDGTNIRQGTAAAPAAGSVTVTLDGAYQPSPTVRVATTASSWGLPTTWSYTPPMPPGTGPITIGNANTTLTILGWTSSSVNLICADVSVSSSVPGQPWLLNINTSFAPWNGVTTGYYLQGDSAGVLIQPVAGVGYVQEASWSSPQGAPRQFQVCNASLPTPPAPSTVVVNATNDTGVVLGSWTRSTTSVCLPVTITHTTPGRRTWALDLDVASAPFSGVPPTFTGTAGANIVTAPSPDRPGWLRLTGTNPYDTVHQNGPVSISFTICSQTG